MPDAGPTDLDGYLAMLEADLDEAAAEKALLWPRTPLDAREYQQKITERVGVSDADAGDPRSRSYRLPNLIEELRRAGSIAEDFSLVDVACGDGLILIELKRRFPESRCFGIDLNAGVFPPHSTAEQLGVPIKRILIQDLFATPTPEQFDVVMMLNTYRGWENADLSQADRELPRMADDWMIANARVIVLTATVDQLPQWADRGFAVTDFGPGEENSRLVVITRRRLPLRTRLAAWRARRHA
jgi:hypothetical protein